MDIGWGAKCKICCPLPPLFLSHTNLEASNIHTNIASFSCFQMYCCFGFCVLLTMSWSANEANERTQLFPQSCEDAGTPRGHWSGERAPRDLQNVSGRTGLPHQAERFQIFTASIFIFSCVVQAYIIICLHVRYKPSTRPIFPTTAYCKLLQLTINFYYSSL